MLDQSQLAVIGVANLPMLGLHGSGQIKSLVTHIASEIRQSPRLTVFVVLPPNQPVFGTGKVSKVVREQKVLADGIYLHRCTGLYDHDTMYSDERDLGVELWCAGAVQHFCAAEEKSCARIVAMLSAKLHAQLRKDLAFANAGNTHGDGDLERFLVCKLVGLHWA